MKYHLELDIDLKRNPGPGFYIALEGIDGSGKTTQVELLAKYFAQRGDVIVTSEPKMDGFGGVLIQQIFQAKVHIPPVAFQHLLTANRLVNHQEVVLPGLQSGKTVLSDRCFWSALAYGIMDLGVDYSSEAATHMLVAQSVLSMYHQITQPDIIFYLDISATTAMQRLKQRDDQQMTVYEKKEKLQKVVKGYRWLAKNFPGSFVTINAEQAIDEIYQDMIEKIEELFPRLKT